MKPERILWRWIFSRSLGALSRGGALLACGWLLAGCPAPPPERKPWLPMFEGVVQLGPAVSGQVTVRALDDRLSPVGEAAEGNSWWPDGGYTVEYGFPEGPVLVEARGTFCDELTGRYPRFQEVSLRAMATVHPRARVNVNLLTTLAAGRIVELATRGELPFDAAKVRAEREVLGAFGLPAEGVAPFETLDLAGDGPGDAMLLAVCALMLQAYETTELNAALAGIAEDLASNGALGTGTRERLREAARSLNCHTVRTNLLAYWAHASRSGAVVPLFEAWLDSDGDGRLNRDQDPGVTDVTDTSPVLLDRLPLRITFDAPMDPDGLRLSGELAAEVGEVTWSSSRFTGDTLGLHPVDAWPTGDGRTLVLSATSVFGRVVEGHTQRPAFTDRYAVYTSLMDETDPLAVTRTRDGGLAFVAARGPGGRSALLVRLDADLNVSLEAQLYVDYEVFSLVEAEDGGFFLAGQAASLARVARVKPNGDSAWLRNRTDVFVEAVAPDRDGGVLVCGQTRPDAGGQRLFLWRLDAQGEDVSHCELASSGTDLCTSLLPTAEGDFLVVTQTTSVEFGAGPCNRQVRVIRTDADCQVSWQIGVGGVGDDRLEWARNLPDGGFLLGGQTNSWDLFSDTPYVDEELPNGYLVRLSADGGLLWQQAPDAGGYDDAWSVAALPDGGAVSAGRFLRYDPDCQGDSFPCPFAGVRITRWDPAGTPTVFSEFEGGVNDARPAVALVDSDASPRLITHLLPDWFGGDAAGLLGSRRSGILVLELSGN